MENQFVVFNLAGEYYGVGISAVDSIVKLWPGAVAPRAPDFAERVTNLRGTVLPVIDLRKRFDLPAGKATRQTRIVVVKAGRRRQAGVVVDAVSEVLQVSEEDIQPLSSSITTSAVSHLASGFITGIARVDKWEGVPGRPIILLDLNKVLLAEEKADLKAIQVKEE